jgi:hypothetical protein
MSHCVFWIYSWLSEHNLRYFFDKRFGWNRCLFAIPLHVISSYNGNNMEFSSSPKSSWPMRAWWSSPPWTWFLGQLVLFIRRSGSSHGCGCGWRRRYLSPRWLFLLLRPRDDTVLEISLQKTERWRGYASRNVRHLERSWGCHVCVFPRISERKDRRALLSSFPCLHVYMDTKRKKIACFPADSCASSGLMFHRMYP